MADAVVEGAFVELHSLSSADMNGRVGFCGPFNSGTGSVASISASDTAVGTTAFHGFSPAFTWAI